MSSEDLRAAWRITPIASRGRVLTALAHTQPDRTPRDFWAEPPAWTRLLAQVGHDDRDRLTFHGGMDMQNLLPHGTPEQVLFQPDVPPENTLAVYRDGCQRMR